MKKLPNFRFLVAVLILGVLIIATLYKDPRLSMSPEQALALNIYHEARGESLLGQRMVAYVTVERARENRSYWGGPTIQGVIFQDCQFSWTCENVLPANEGEEEWQTAQEVAQEVLQGLFTPSEPIARARYYINPDKLEQESKCWFGLNLVPVGVVGNHHFFAEPLPNETYPISYNCMPLPRPNPLRGAAAQTP